MSIPIPVRCFSCGKDISHLWEPYFTELQQMVEADPSLREAVNISESTGASPDVTTPVGKLLTKYTLIRECCRRMFMGHVESFN